jgi:hypothetical protein
MSKKAATYHVKWGNPYTAPPNKMPRIIYEVFIRSEGWQQEKQHPGYQKAKKILKALEEKGILGYKLCCTPTDPDAKPYQAWTRERRQQNQCYRLKMKAEKMFPLLIDYHHAWMQGKAIENPKRYGICPLPSEKKCNTHPKEEIRENRRAAAIARENQLRGFF